ncbi:MAG: HD domain-containing protein [Azonexus sp.]|nr:HD domain-containing protein [Betaproteobacteria bacterium]MBK8916549.1 HD domain-containing protein [Betaproteobacteria bacterium]MBP6036890.1 HD domain-containing protein [Azonexus sp.]MBP6907494.1 HD domain-containing protein [Azonexus sp.]
MANFNISLHQAIYSLSDALDLVGVTHIHHGKRVAYIAAECGKRLGWSGQRLDDLFQAAILHDCGVSKTIIHSRLAQLEWEHENDHCDNGAALLARCPLLAKFSEVVRHHHTHWQALAGIPLSEETALAANCIYLADRVDILTLASLKDNANVLLGIDETRRRVAERRGSWFHPDLVDAFFDLARSEAFWFRLEGDQVAGYAAGWLEHGDQGEIAFAELRSLFHIFSVIVDAKSSFTSKHSDAVARLARFLGERIGLDQRRCELLELAGLLHDLGKLRIPDEYLEKPGKLTAEEYAIVRRHSFDTYNVLKNIRGLEEVALWAAQHHERVDGSGYPYHLRRDSLSLEARIVAVADVFQALEQHRPYRAPLPPGEILSILREEADAEKLDADVIACVAANLDECWRIAFIE